MTPACAQDSPRPNFFLIGASKCGTTTVWHMLKGHPDIYMCEPKEPWFFSGENYDKGWDWYLSLFSGASDEKVVGEAGTNYARVNEYPHVPQMLYDFAPDARLLYIVRHPLRRIESAWIQCLSTGHDMPRRFDEAVLKYPPLIEGCRYWTNLNAFRRYFPDEQIYVMIFEDFVDSPLEEFNKLCDFLGVDRQAERECVTQKNRASDKSMDHWIYHYMKRLPGYAPVESLMPRRIKSRINSLLTVPVPPKPMWSAELKAKVMNEVRQDCQEILRHAGNPSHRWDIAKDKLEGGTS